LVALRVKPVIAWPFAINAGTGAGCARNKDPHAQTQYRRNERHVV
jgi:hypothetical protein